MTDSNETKNNRVGRQAVVVLGMHRAGTSALAGLLTELGGDGPSNPLGPSKNNPMGHFESRALYLLQDRLLASAGSTWSDYRSFPASWYQSPKADEFCHEVKDLLISEYGSSSFFILKDPRNCRLVPFWRDLLTRMEVRQLFVHTHRNPLEVARSLQKRDGFDLEYGCLLWLRHVLDAEAGSRGLCRSFTSYDRLLASWPAEVEKIARDLSIQWPRYHTANLPRLDEMIRPDLRRNDTPAVTESKVFATWFRDVLAVMDRWAAHGERVEDHAVLDRIRQSFDDSVEVFGNTVQAKGRALQTERDDAREKAEAAQKIADEARKDVDKAHAQGAELQAELEAMTTERDKVAMQLDLSRNMLDQRKAEIDDTQDDLDKTRAALAEAVEGAEALAQDLGLAQQQIQALQASEARRNREFAKVQTALLAYQDGIASEDKSRQDQAAKLVTDLKDRLAKADARVHALMTSNSWKITAPLRWFIERFKR